MIPSHEMRTMKKNEKSDDRDFIQKDGVERKLNIFVTYRKT